MSARSNSSGLLITGVIGFGTLSIGLVLYSQWLTSRNLEQNASLIRLTQTVQQEVATAHLWFEEALGGDGSIDLDTDVHEHLINAVKMIEGELVGGDVDSSRVDPLPSVRLGLSALKDNIVLLDRLAESRWAARDSTGIIGGAEDQAFDGVFAEIMLQSRAIAEDVDAFIAEDQTKIFVINAWNLVVLVVVFFALAALVMWNRRATEAKAAELEVLVEERTAKLAAREAEARERNAELSRARDQANAASDAKSQFLANMSHEIRTPMNGVVGMASLLTRTELSATQKEYVDTLHKSGLALLAIINAVLDYSKIEAGKITLDSAEFSLKTVIEDTLHLFSAEAARKNIVLSSSIGEGVPVNLHGDLVRLGEIFSNLVSNAIKFSEDGEITVSCALSEHQLEGDSEIELLFEVTDPGIGIAKEYLEDLFEHFSQVDESPTRLHGGTGLGLAICRELVMLMGGEIGVRSEPGAGSTFWFTVRLHPATEIDGIGAVEDVEESYANYSLRNHVPERRLNIDAKVLVVDDNQVNLLVAQRMLEELGFKVDLAADGQEAIDAVDQSHYAAILIDSQMPGMDGNEATRIIRRTEGEDQHTPIIALTANAMAPDRAKAFAAGVDDYLSKPVFLEDLERSLNRLLGLPGEESERPIVVGESTGSDAESQESILDASVVRELLAIGSPKGDSDLFSDLAGEFLNQMPVWLDEIRHAAAAGDAETVRRLAHKVLGTCRQIGAGRLANVCVDLESVDVVAEDGQVIREVEVLEREFDTVHHELKTRYLS